MMNRVKDVVSLSATPTLDTNQYADKDALHTADIEFSGATRRGGGSGYITKVVFIDRDDQGIAMDLWLFSAPLANTTHTANAAWAVHDTDLATCIAVIPSGTFNDGGNGQVAVVDSKQIHFHSAATRTSIYGVLVSRGAGTYSASGVTVVLTIAREE